MIAKKVLGTPLSAAEEEALNTWSQKEENKAALKEIEKRTLANRLLDLEQERYGEKMAERFFKQQRRMRRQRLYSRTNMWLGIAAMLCIVVSVVLTRLPKLSDEHPELLADAVSSIVPGEVKATLTLADGREFGIDDADTRRIDQLIDSVHAKAGAKDPEAARRQMYHKLSVPQGGEFRHVLVDGTTVWLNSESELRFPESFEAGERRVYLKGEAYFEVAKDTARPFIISTSRGDIRVYGTTFNVTDYEGEPFSTVLVQGSIGFRPAKGDEVQLHPSERMEYDEETGSIKVETVDVSTYTAWVDHYFIFHAQSLEEIMKTLSRWYGFNTVFVHDNLRDIKLSGRLYRYEDIRMLLDSYEQTANVKFYIKGQNIIIT